MSVLLVGTAPPPGGALALTLARRAHEGAAAGEDVVVLSPDLRSAAQRHARLDGVALSVYLAYYARRFDALELCIEERLAFDSAKGRLVSRIELRLLSLALARWSEVTLRLDHPSPLDAAYSMSAARAVLSRADAIVVLDPADAERCASLGGVARDRIVVVAGVREGIGQSPLSDLLGARRVPPGRGVVLFVVYERLRHLAALALRRR